MAGQPPVDSAYCPRCGLRAAGEFLAITDERFCFLCADGEADAERAREVVEATAADQPDAYRILELIDDPRAFDVVLEGTTHPSPRVRAACLFALARCGDPRASAPARRLLWDDDRAVHRAAITCLADLPDTESGDTLAEGLDHWPDDLDLATALAWRRDERGFERLVEAVRDGVPTLRNVTRSPHAALLWYGADRAVPHLVAALDAMARRWIDSDRTDWAARRQADELASLLVTVEQSGADAAVERAKAAFGGLNTAYARLTSAPPQPAPPPPTPPHHTVPRWSLRLHRATGPVIGPVTRFGGQPTWLTAPTWPLTLVGTPMTFFAQFRLPWRDDAMAYLFLDLGSMGMSHDGGAALIVQPGLPPVVPHDQRPSGPTYPHEGTTDFSRFRPDGRREQFVSVPDLVPGFDPEDWEAEPHEHADDEAAWNKVGGAPCWLQGPEHPGPSYRFLFQFSAGRVGYELGDAAECYGFVDPDGRGVFTWQCH